MLEPAVNFKDDKENTGFHYPEKGYGEQNDINRALIRFNRSLDPLADLALLNERILDSKLDVFEAMTSETGLLQLMILSRLTELAIRCAANYAGSGHITEMGDLIINPRRIHVHIRNKSGPVVKHRHGRLSQQFKDYCETRQDVVEWMKSNTIIEIVKEPIIPHLIDLLKNNHCPSAYLDSVEERVALIVEIAAGTSPRRAVMDVGCLEPQVPDETHEEILKILHCRFDTLFFSDFGNRFRRIMIHPD